jgi:glycosyltransferase involved in cell wall biosynthesis
MMPGTKNTCPRVLVLTQNKIQPFSGGGIVLSTLFRRFPHDHLLFFHRDQQYGGDTSYEEHRLVWSWLRFDLGALCAHLAGWLLATCKDPRQSSWRDLLTLISASAYFKFPRAIERRVKAFQPQIIYAWVADSLWARTLENVARRYRLPYVIHFMDNQFEVAPSSNLQRTLVPDFRRRLSHVVHGAASVYTISQTMGEAYQQHWGRPFEVYRGTIDVAAWPWPNVSAHASDGIFRVGFAGSVDRSQLDGLCVVARALDQLTARGRAVKLVLYLTDYYTRLVEPAVRDLKSVEIRPHPTAENLRAEFASMDVMTLAYAFDAATEQYYRYSFATKSVAYMLSGRPILVYGPPMIEPVSYCARGGWALVVGDKGEDAIVEAMERLMSEPKLREQLARSAWEAGCSEHDRERHAARFAASLSQLARAGS